MFSIPFRYVQLTTYVLVVGIGATIAVSWMHAERREIVTQKLEEHFVDSRTLLVSLSQFTARNDAPDDIKALVRDCPSRSEYETMLNSLVNTFPTRDIERATALYDACGDFFALRKRLMILRMESVAADMTVYADLYTAYTKSAQYQEYMLSAWKPLLTMEAERTALLSEQVVLQGTIIRSLSERNKQQLDTYLLRAQEIAESLDVKARQIDELRKAELEQWESLVL